MASENNECSKSFTISSIPVIPLINTSNNFSKTTSFRKVPSLPNNVPNEAFRGTEQSIVIQSKVVEYPLAFSPIKSPDVNNIKHNNDNKKNN